MDKVHQDPTIALQRYLDLPDFKERIKGMRAEMLEVAKKYFPDVTGIGYQTVDNACATFSDYNVKECDVPELITLNHGIKNAQSIFASHIAGELRKEAVAATWLDAKPECTCEICHLRRVAKKTIERENKQRDNTTKMAPGVNYVFTGPKGEA